MPGGVRGKGVICVDLVVRERECLVGHAISEVLHVVVDRLRQVQMGTETALLVHGLLDKTDQSTHGLP